MEVFGILLHVVSANSSMFVDSLVLGHTPLLYDPRLANSACSHFPFSSHLSHCVQFGWIN